MPPESAYLRLAVATGELEPEIPEIVAAVRAASSDLVCEPERLKALAKEVEALAVDTRGHLSDQP